MSKIQSMEANTDDVRIYVTAIMVMTSKDAGGTKNPKYTTWSKIYIILQLLGPNGRAQRSRVATKTDIGF